MVFTVSEVDNPQARQLLERSAKLLVDTGDANAAVSELLRWNKDSGEPVASDELFKLFRVHVYEPFKFRPPVNQEHQELQECQELEGIKKSLKETHRGVFAKPKTSIPEKQQFTAQEARDVYADDFANSRQSRLGLTDFIFCAVEASMAHNRRLHAARKWESPLFQLVRLLRTHRDLKSATAPEAWQAVAKVMQGWQDDFKRRGRSVVSVWDEYFGIGTDEAQAEMLDSWDKVRYLPGLSPLQSAAEMSEQMPVIISDEKRLERGAAYERFVSLAGWLQVTVGDRNILLPVKEIAVMFKMTTMTISRFRRNAIKDGFLDEIKASEFKKHKATEFRFHVERVPILAERACDSSSSRPVSEEGE